MRKRNRRNPPEDSARWAEIEEGSRRGSSTSAAVSASDWRASVPIFGKDTFTATLLQRIDSTGGAGVRFTADSVAQELPAKSRRGAKLRLGPALLELERRGFVRAHAPLPPPPQGKKPPPRAWATTWELTELGSDAALAERIVPQIREGERAGAQQELLPALRKAIASKPSTIPFEGADLTKTEVPPWTGGQRQHEISAQVAAQARAMPWRGWTDPDVFDPVALEGGRRIEYTGFHSGPYVIFRALDRSAYMLGQAIVVGELALLLSTGGDKSFTKQEPFATVAWTWIHPDWDDVWDDATYPPGTDPVISRELHRLAAHEAAVQGLKLASGTALPASADRVWSRQVKAGLATPVISGEQRRYFLQYPPPAQLANPCGKKRRVKNPSQDEELRRLEREAARDPAARLRYYTAALRAGKAYPEWLGMLAILGDETARQVAPPGPEWAHADGSQTIPLKFVNGLNSLGSVFCLLSAVSILEAVVLAGWNQRDTRGIAARIDRVLLVARAWLEDGREPPTRRRRTRAGSYRTPVYGKIRGRAIEVQRDFDAWHGATDPAQVDSQAIGWFFRTPNTPRFADEPSYSDNAIYMLERGLYHADLATSPDYGYLELVAQAELTNAIGHCETLYSEHLATQPAWGPLRINSLPATTEAFSRLLLEVLTPWVLAGSPGVWRLPTTRPLP